MFTMYTETYEVVTSVKPEQRTAVGVNVHGSGNMVILPLITGVLTEIRISCVCLL